MIGEKGKGDMGDVRLSWHPAAGWSRRMRGGFVHKGALIAGWEEKGLAKSTRMARARGMRYLIRALYEWKQWRDDNMDVSDLVGDRRWIWSDEWARGGQLAIKAAECVTLPPSREEFESALFLVAARQSRQSRALAAMAIDEVGRMMKWTNTWNSDERKEQERRITARLNSLRFKASVRPLDMGALDRALSLSWEGVVEMGRKGSLGAWSEVRMKVVRTHAAVVVCLAGLMRAGDCAGAWIAEGHARGLIEGRSSGWSSLPVFLTGTKTGNFVARLRRASVDHWDPLVALEAWVRLYEAWMEKEGRQWKWLQGVEKKGLRVSVVGLWRRLDGVNGVVSDLWSDLKAWLREFYVRPEDDELVDKRDESPHSFRATAAVGVLPVIGADRTRSLGRWRGTGAYDIYVSTQAVNVGDILRGGVMGNGGDVGVDKEVDLEGCLLWEEEEARAESPEV